MDNTIRVQDHPLVAVAWKNVKQMEDTISDEELLDYLSCGEFNHTSVSTLFDNDIEYTAEEAKLINDDLPF